jgi:hypothetical protein
MPLKQCQQNILLRMLSNGHKTTFFDQDIYSSFRVFKGEMQELRNADLINMKTIDLKGKFIIEYSLSVDGLIFGKFLKFINEKLIA